MKMKINALVIRWQSVHKIAFNGSVRDEPIKEEMLAAFQPNWT